MKLIPVQADGIVTALAQDTIVVPEKCRTPAYVAGPGESAIVDVRATLSPVA